MSIVFSSQKLHRRIEKPSFWPDSVVPKIYSLFLFVVQAATNHRDLCAMSFLNLKRGTCENEYLVGCFENCGVSMIVSFRPCASDTCSEEMVVKGAKRNG